MRHRPSSESTDDGGTTQDPAPTTSLVLVTQDHVDSACLQKLYCLRQTWSRLYSVINICEDASFRDLVLDGSKLGVYSRPQAIDWEDTKNKLKPWATLGVLLTVEVCKTMDVYNELLLSDRALLLKNVAFKSYHLTIAFDSYQNKKGRIFSPVGGEVFPSMMFSIMPCYEVIMELLVTCVEPLIRLQLSEQEYMLLNMILICNPGIRGMSPGGQDTLSRHQKYYSRILLKHCLLQDPRHGPSRFSALLTINQCLERQVAITQRLAAMLRKHWNPNYCLPRILREACRMEDIYV
uniref:NR LBD domain-containing protein n=1 Tax=Caenorhabditis japonica TaxID=281687 RepID=A0A8R1DLQ7_CAEJA